jgi:3-dehydroquinate synthase
LLHGEAVAIGMICASRLAERRGLIDTEVTNRQSRLLQAFQLPTSLPLSKSFTTDDVLNRMKLDKKTVSGSLRFVLPTRLGEVQIFADISLDDVRAVLN